MFDFDFERLTSEEYIQDMNKTILLSRMSEQMASYKMSMTPEKQIKRCKVSVARKLPKTINQLILSIVNVESYITLKIVSEIAVISSIQFLGQDENEDLIKVSLYNYQSFYQTSNRNELQELFKEGKYMIIINPFYKVYMDGIDGIRIDNPNEILLFKSKKQMEDYLNKEIPDREESLQEGLSYFELIGFKKEIKILINKINANPNNDKLYVQLAENYYVLKNYIKAKDNAYLALKVNRLNSKASLIIYKCFLGLKMYDKASAFLIDENCVMSSSLKAKLKQDIKILQDNTKGIFDFPKMIEEEREKLFITIGDYINPKLRKETDSVKGIKIISTDNIKKGELLVVSKAFESIPNDFQMPLSMKVEQLTSMIKDKLDSNISYFDDFFSLYNGNNLKSTIEERIKSKKITHEEISNIIKCNGISTIRSMMKEKMLVFGLWTFPSLFNHSCLPNTYYFGIGDCIVIIAQQDIKANEEITINYISCEYEYSIRNKGIMEGWGFECMCPLCEYEKKALKNSSIKQQCNIYMKMFNESLNTKNIENFKAHPEEVPNFLELNKKEMNCYELGISYYLYGYLIRKEIPEKSCECLLKGLRYCKGRYFRFETAILYYLLCVYKDIGKMDKYMETLEELRRTLRTMFTDESFITILINESIKS